MLTPPRQIAHLVQEEMAEDRDYHAMEIQHREASYNVMRDTLKAKVAHFKELVTKKVELHAANVRSSMFEPSPR